MSRTYRLLNKSDSSWGSKEVRHEELLQILESLTSDQLIGTQVVAFDSEGLIGFEDAKHSLIPTIRDIGPNLRTGHEDCRYDPWSDGTCRECEICKGFSSSALKGG